MFPPQLPTIFMAGRLTADPELRFTPSGVAVATFTVASSNQKKDGDQWVDDRQCFLRCTVWREKAEAVSESLRRGDPVTVWGKLSQREYETREGEKRTAFEVQVDALAAEVDRNPVRIERAQRGSQQNSQGSDDPWAGSAPDGDPPF